jgi:hypothetical protein
MADWTLIYHDPVAGNVTNTLADWGISELDRERNSLATHTVTLIAEGRELDAADLFAYGATVEIFRPDGKRWFYGRVEPVERNGEPDRENHFYRLAGIGWYLENLAYKQIYQFGSGQNAIRFATPHVFLNLNLAGKITTGAQISDALAYAISQGAPITIGNIAPWAVPPVDEVKNITCMEVMHKMFRWEPDMVMHVDETTMPYPTIHFLKPGNLDPAGNGVGKLVPVTIDLNAGSPLVSATVKPRPDWQRPFVNLTFEQVNNGFLNTVSDIWPNPLPPQKFGGLETAITLQGLRSSQNTAVLTSAPIDINGIQANAGTRNWSDWAPSIVSPNISNVALRQNDPNPLFTNPAITCVELDAQGNAVDYDPNCKYELVEGEHTDWLAQAPNNIKAQRVRITAYADFTYANTHRENAKQLMKEVTLISVNTAQIATTYTQTIVQQYQDPIPVGLAKIIWQACQLLACEGRLHFTEQDCSGLVEFSNSLNLKSASQPAWANLNAIIQGITEKALSGETTVKFGAPQHLTAGDFVDLLRVARNRNILADINMMIGNALSSLVPVYQGRKTHASHAQHGSPLIQKSVISSAQGGIQNGVDPYVTHDGQTGISQWAPVNGPVVAPVILDPKNALGSDGNWHPVILREIKIGQQQADGSCKQRSMIILGSLIFQGAGDPN